MFLYFVGGKTVSAMDILVPGVRNFCFYEQIISLLTMALEQVGELIGGSQREERYGVLMERLKELKLEEADYCEEIFAKKKLFNPTN